MEDTLGARLKWARNAAGLTQRDVARHIGVTPQAIQHLESGSSRTSRFVYQMANALGVSVEWLEKGIGTPKEAGRVENSVETALKHLGAADVVDVVLAPSDPYTKLAFFPPEEVAFRPKHLPVFVSIPLFIAVTRNQSYMRLIDNAASLLPHVKTNTEDDRQTAAGMDFSVCTTALPDDYVARPAYLEGQAGAYAVFLGYSSHMQPRLRGSEILHIDPSGRPLADDLVLAWTGDNTFLAAEFVEETEDYISVNVYHPEPWSLRSLHIPLDRLRGLHRVRGLEFNEPRSAKVKFGRFSLVREGKILTGVSGIGGIDPTKYEGPDEPD